MEHMTLEHKSIPLLVSIHFQGGKRGFNSLSESHQRHLNNINKFPAWRSFMRAMSRTNVVSVSCLAAENRQKTRDVSFLSCYSSKTVFLKIGLMLTLVIAN